MMGLKFVRVIPSGFAEDLKVSSFDTPAGYCLTTAIKKAEDVILRKSPELIPTGGGHVTSILISSDTVVELDGAVLEKPSSRWHAGQMLRTLSGQTHSVLSAVSIYQGKGGRDFSLQCSFVEKSIVTFMDLESSDIDAYVDTGEAMDKAGSYGIQGFGGQFVSRIEGDYFNIMGLPTHRLGSELAKILTHQ